MQQDPKALSIEEDEVNREVMKYKFNTGDLTGVGFKSIEAKVYYN